jgi:hypothetical protein|tara:strand:- start:1912 stop:2058 length:147 start_codon:yes stop_codon:yes gene_type:complete
VTANLGGRGLVEGHRTGNRLVEVLLEKPADLGARQLIVPASKKSAKHH